MFDSTIDIVYDNNDGTTCDFYMQVMAFFGFIAPTYHITTLDKPAILWDFHSLILGFQSLFSFVLTDNKNCYTVAGISKTFMEEHPNAVFYPRRSKN